MGISRGIPTKLSKHALFSTDSRRNLCYLVGVLACFLERSAESAMSALGIASVTGPSLSLHEVPAEILTNEDASFDIVERKYALIYHGQLLTSLWLISMVSLDGQNRQSLIASDFGSRTQIAALFAVLLYQSV